MQTRLWLKGKGAGLRRWAVWVVAAVAIGAGAYLGVPALVPDKLVQAQVNAEIGRWTGGAFRLRHGTKISVEPGFRVIVSDPVFLSASDVMGGADSGPVVTADAIVAPLRIFPLLFGRVEIEELVLMRPNIDLSKPVGHFAASEPPKIDGKTSTGQTLQFGDVILVDGTLRFSGATGMTEVSGLNLRLEADAVTNAITVQGRAFFDARHLRFGLQLDDLRALVSDVGTHAKLNVRFGTRTDNEPGDVALSNHAIPYEVTKMLQYVADASGLSGAGFGAMDAEGIFSVTPHVVTISGATFSIGDLDMKGDMRAETIGRPVVARLLGLPDVVRAMVADAKEINDGRWVDVPMTMAWIEGLDLDVRLAGEVLPSRNSILDSAAVSLVVRDATTSLDLAGNIEGIGDIEAKLALEHKIGEPVELMASGHVDTMEVDKTSEFLAMMGPPPLIGTAQLPKGTMTGAFDVNAKGNTLGQMADSLNGSVTAQLKDGSLVGADLVATLETLRTGREFMTEDKGPLVPAAGRTQFDQLDARVDLASGTASISQVEIVGEQFEVGMFGEVRLTEGIMNVGGNAVLLSSPVSGSQPGEALVDLPFGVGGTVFAPVVAAGVPILARVWADTDTNAGN